MKNILLITLFVAMLSVGLHGQAVSVTDKDAFLQGQLDATRAETVGNTLASYCAGYASIMTGPYFRPIMVPVECQQFWTYVDVYGPMFWYPGYYDRYRPVFYLQFGHYNRYGWVRTGHDMGYYARPPFHSRGTTGTAVPRSHRK